MGLSAEFENWLNEYANSARFSDSFYGPYRVCKSVLEFAISADFANSLNDSANSGVSQLVLTYIY